MIINKLNIREKILNTLREESVFGRNILLHFLNFLFHHISSKNIFIIENKYLQFFFYRTSEKIKDHLNETDH